MREVMRPFGWLTVALVLIALHVPAQGASAEDEPQPIRVLESALAVVPAPSCIAVPPDPLRSVLVAVRVENPNPLLAAEGVRLSVRLFGADGGTIADVESAELRLLPGERRAVLIRYRLEPDAPAIGAHEVALTGPATWRRAPAIAPPDVSPDSTFFPATPGLGRLSGTCLPAEPNGPRIGFSELVAQLRVFNPLDVAVPE